MYSRGGSIETRPKQVSDQNQTARIDGHIECIVPIVARPGDGDGWHASLEIPRELFALPAKVQLDILDTVTATLEEIRRLNGRTEDRSGMARQPWLMLSCGLWMRRTLDEEWRASVNFSWPDVWADFSRDAREAVLTAVAELLMETRWSVEARLQDAG